MVRWFDPQPHGRLKNNASDAPSERENYSANGRRGERSDSKTKKESHVQLFSPDKIKIIYQQFYKSSSAIDRGTLAQLRSKVNRVDVKGSDRVIDSYRAHSAFIDNCLDAFIVGACLHHLGMENTEYEPKHKRILFEAMSAEDMKMFLEEIATEI